MIACCVLASLVLLLFSQCAWHIQAHTLYLLPSFQGTMLQKNGKHIHLAPLTPSTYAKAYSLLTDGETGISRYTEYPTVTCGPSTHAGHCTALPGKGAISKLSKRYNVTTIGYDWRVRSSKVLPMVTRRVSRFTEGGILLAHGTGCLLGTLINSSNVRLVCLSPLSKAFSKDAINKGEGLLTLGDAHGYKHAGDERVTKDFGMMGYQLGLVSRRRLLPETRGAWDERQRFAAPLEERLKVIANMESVLEYDEMGRLGVGESSLCVQGSGVGEGCEGFLGKVVNVDVGFFDLVGLVEGALKEIESESTRRS